MIPLDTERIVLRRSDGFEKVVDVPLDTTADYVLAGILSDVVFTSTPERDERGLRVFVWVREHAKPAAGTIRG